MLCASFICQAEVVRRQVLLPLPRLFHDSWAQDEGNKSDVREGGGAMGGIRSSIEIPRAEEVWADQALDERIPAYVAHGQRCQIPCCHYRWGTCGDRMACKQKETLQRNRHIDPGDPAFSTPALHLALFGILPLSSSWPHNLRARGAQQQSWQGKVHREG